MRIIGGKYRGKKLISPASAAVRPTSDKARGALFNILRSRAGGHFSELSLVDIFAGSGAFALEAISQGFADVALVDVNVADLQKNVKLFEAEKNKISVIKADITKTLKLEKKYDVLFMDAPYNQGLSELALKAVKSYLKNGAVCMVELERNEQIKIPEGFEQIDERHYGIAKVLVLTFIG